MALRQRGWTGTAHAAAFAVLWLITSVDANADAQTKAIDDSFSEMSASLARLGGDLNVNFDESYSKFDLDVSAMNRSPPWGLGDPVDVISNFSEGSFANVASQIKYYSWQSQNHSIESFCDEIKNSRALPFGAGRKLPVVIVDFKWSSQIEQNPFSTRCFSSSHGAFDQNPSPIFMEIPIGVSGNVVLEPEAGRFSPWITPNHIAVAALSTLPEGQTQAFGPDIQPVQVGECTAKPDQPDFADLEAALTNAECIVTTEDGDRRVGAFPIKYLSRPKRRPGSLDPELSSQNLDTIQYSLYGHSNGLENWADIDDGLLDMPIDLHVVEKEGDNKLVWQFCRNLKQTSNDSDPRNVELFRSEICKWRDAGDLRLWRHDELSEQLLFDLSREMNNVIIGEITSYIELLKRQTFQSKFSPIAFRLRETEADRDKSPREWLLSNLLTGNYPLSNVVWVYLDPAILQNQNVRKFLISMAVTGEVTNNEFASFAEIKKILEKK